MKSLLTWAQQNAKNQPARSQAGQLLVGAIAIAYQDRTLAQLAEQASRRRPRCAMHRHADTPHPQQVAIHSQARLDEPVVANSRTLQLVSSAWTTGACWRCARIAADSGANSTTIRPSPSESVPGEIDRPCASNHAVTRRKGRLATQSSNSGLQPAVLDPQGHDRAALARVDADVGKKCLKTIDLRAQMQRIPRHTAQVLRFRPRRLERVPGPTPLRFPVPRLAVRLDLLSVEPFGSPVRSIRAALLFLVKPAPDLRNARRTSNRKAVRQRTRARRHRVQWFLKT